MDKDLTQSPHDRQNILNNKYALQQAEKHLALGGVIFQGETVFTKQQVMALFGISERTIERYLVSHEEELKKNGYRLLRGIKLTEFKDLSDGTDIHDGTKTSVMGRCTFRTVLNRGMLLTESKQAKVLRGRLLDIVIDVISSRTGGHTRYINQRDENYLFSAFQEENYRREFTDALDKYVEGDRWKYAKFTNLIYQSIFHENTAEYKKILRLAANVKIRNTMYSEVLTLIAGFESSVAD